MYNLDLSHYSTLIFDFDGVFTDNTVYMDENGIEFSRFSRADGYGINLLAKAKDLAWHNLNYFVLSTEMNPVVSKRCQKMNLPYVQGCSNKYQYLKERFTKNCFDSEHPFKKLIYVGNDLNDLPIVMEAGFTFCPNDAHPHIKSKSSYISERKGGQDFVREIVEILLGFENRGIGEINELIYNR